MMKVTEQQYFFINKINTTLGKSLIINESDNKIQNIIKDQTIIQNENNNHSLTYKKEEERVLGGTDYKKFEEISKILDKDDKDKDENNEKIENKSVDKLKMGCSNDLRKERQLYDKSTKEKIYAAKVFKEEGDLYIKKKQYDTANISYEKAMTQLFYTFEDTKEDEIEVDKLKLLLNSNIAMCKIGLFQYKDAVGYLNEVLKIDKSNIKTIYRLAYIFFKIEDFHLSKTYISDGIRILNEKNVFDKNELDAFIQLENDVLNKEKENNLKLEGLFKKMIK